MPTTTARIDQLSPQRTARRKRPAHHQAQPAVFRIAAGDLRRERQELFIEQSGGVEVAEKLGTAFDKDARRRAGSPHRVQHGDRGNFVPVCAHGGDLYRIGNSLRAQPFRARGCRHDQRLHIARAEDRQPEVDFAAAADDDVERGPAPSQTQPQSPVVIGEIGKIASAVHTW